MSDALTDISVKTGDNAMPIVASVCDPIIDQFMANVQPTLKRLTDGVYCNLLDAMQDYLKDNAHWNLSNEIERVWRIDLQNENLKKQVNSLEDLLQRCAEFIEPYVDVVDGAYGEPSPNAAMSLLSDIREVLPEGK